MTEDFGFELLSERDVPELRTKACLFRHLRTGAQLLSLQNDDENKVFGITFRTPPPDSTGIAHIMEHAVLCGSEKYPVKEPFVELVKGSLNTFLNAFTFPDKTCYPVASQNLQDFYNLIDVYVDAVFYPLIPPHILQQEGWHYEMDDLDAPLTYKGVVFNEMKGAYSDPDNLLGRVTQQSLFPDNAYGVDSGGDPHAIPNLTYANFKSFHENYYHPSNSRIFFYGDDDPQERLRRMDAYLKEFAAIPIQSSISLQPRFDKPRQQTVSFDPGEGENSKKGMQVVNWALDELKEPQVALAAHILAHILIGTPASPLRKALIDSGLGEDLAGSGLDAELRQAYFSIGLKGIVSGEDNQLIKGDQVVSLIFQTLESLVEQGIDPDTVAASLNTIEFRLRENNTGSFPRGLSLMLRSLEAWLYDHDPISALSYEAPLAAIKERVAAGDRYFEDLVQRWFLNNSHRTTIAMQPEPGLSQREDEAEKERLARTRAGMTQAELQDILKNTAHLKQLQETPDMPEALATIPQLALQDIEKLNKTIPLEVSSLDGCKLLYHDLFTNGILYLDIGFNLHCLPQEYLPYVPLFGRALVEMGTETEDFVKLSQRIGRYTGGIRPSSFTSLVKGTDQGTAWQYLRGKSTVDQAGDLLAILRDMLLTVRLDNQERFRQMVLEEKAGQEAGLIPSGHRVVNTRLRALYNEADWASEQMNGISHLYFLRELAESVEKDWVGVLHKLQTIHSILLNRQAMLCNVTLDQASWTQFQPRLTDFLAALPSASSTKAEWKPAVASRFEGLTIPAQVNYVGKGANLYELGYQPHGSVSVISKFLGTTWLWEKVRVQGGAYGGFCTFDHRSGILSFLSYRDPNLLATLENFDQTSQFLRNLTLSQEEITKNIIGTIGDLDAYQLPDAKGFTSMARHLVGDTDQSRQLWRDQVLRTTIQDIKEFGIILEELRQKGSVIVLGSSEEIEKANNERQGWLKVSKVL